ncbi:LysR family transcriptional regulator substrate-binding protein [Bacillus sp. FJAT-50079]|uniref:LysR family transcriptional regulator substrate-binding protein n=1 Tax=Bacillus sp. FJAT-50079 TaxID=2833577 RepID=UPI001BC938E2|nr:LysR family transcriptional regulator substrate-binding protein [Bacillus sp. FJAT-50079]MBS4208064.1 LysR family transcriptional regulator substrate-binding protein [Bacillus sp. FJAT-50079]
MPQLQGDAILRCLLLRPSNTEQYETKTLKEEPNILIVSNRWTTSLSTQPTLKEIAHLPFIMLGAMEGYSFHGDLLKAFEKHGVKPNIIIECKDIPLLVALVNRGLGIPIIPRMNYKSLFVEHLKIYEFSQFDFNVEPVLMKLKDAPISKAATKFWEMVK